MNIKIIVATHKKYRMPEDSIYLPIHVGANGNVIDDFLGDDTGDNISKKNPSYCELTGLYWAYRNLDCEYLGLAHYRRHFAQGRFTKRHFGDRFRAVATGQRIESLLERYDVILPRKMNYVIESIYDHYIHTHYPEPLDETRRILAEFYPEYLDSFDQVMNHRAAHMFNMFVMKKTDADRYCHWMFAVLEELESRVDISWYNAFQARVYGRISELLLNVWIIQEGLTYKELPIVYMENVHWVNKFFKFMISKLMNRKY